jgi:hypothetical protein
VIIVSHFCFLAFFSLTFEVLCMQLLQVRGLPPSNLSAVLQEEREKRQAVERQESMLYEDVLKRRQHIE